jgi:ATP-dependent DNA ligase
VVQALGALPDETVINKRDRRPGGIRHADLPRPATSWISKSAIFYYVFDVLILSGRKVVSEPLSERRAFPSRHVLANLDEPIRRSPEVKASLPI